MIFICNPNNPTGWLIDKKEILELANHYEDSNFVLDEAFIDFAPDETLLRDSISSNIIVLRSLTKFYGLAGLRFGYAVAFLKLLKE